ncbi:AraC family transcriptional regulator [Chryseobacterium sp. ISL-6]|uniref:AraC family transcriptional regulator n=1 Tax=Chryseobacterium sp. ISL-6 TaxID=2819143 RepID=UPI001BE72CA1|nr:AraC family transcriptional regulator [Chryseobacterium sp. ISL-6]MBT2623709.1 helix-turn-helix transcriptional regulator [Chryseobacterium sp. ISL-6]
MSNNKNLESFYFSKFSEMPTLPPIGAGEFNVFCLADTIANNAHAIYARYDFFKIMVIKGKHRCHYADKSIAIDGYTLLFFNPSVPYRFERLETNADGFFCVFKESFFTESQRKGVHDLPVFIPGGKPVYRLSEQQQQEVVSLFEKMLAENKSSYKLKYDLLRNYVGEIIHLAMKMEPNEQLYHHPDTNARITSIFTHLLECQFPINSPENFVKMRSAKDFAEKLGLHVNHLNRAVRLTTGKTTTEHIADRILAEATALLKYTDWNISEISYCLGFTQPSHFTYFFKKHNGITPTSVRFV